MRTTLTLCFAILVCLPAVVHQPLHAQPDSSARPAEAATVTTSSRKKYFVPYVGFYGRLPLVLILDVGVRGGVEIVRDIVGITAEVGIIASPPASESSRGIVFGAHALRLEVTPIPAGFMKPFALHAERRFVGGTFFDDERIGFGFMYRMGKFPSRHPLFFIDCSFLYLRDESFPAPFIGAGMLLSL